MRQELSLEGAPVLPIDFGLRPAGHRSRPVFWTKSVRREICAGGLAHQSYSQPQRRQWTSAVASLRLPSQGRPSTRPPKERLTQPIEARLLPPEQVQAGRSPKIRGDPRQEEKPRLERRSPSRALRYRFAGTCHQNRGPHCPSWDKPYRLARLPQLTVVLHWRGAAVAWDCCVHAGPVSCHGPRPPYSALRCSCYQIGALSKRSTRASPAHDLLKVQQASANGRGAHTQRD